MPCRMYYRNKSQIHAQYKKSFFHLHRIKISTHFIAVPLKPKIFQRTILGFNGTAMNLFMLS